MGDGDYKILVDSLPRDIRLKTAVKVKPAATFKKNYTMNTKTSEIIADPAGAEMLMEPLEGDEEKINGFFRTSSLRTLVYMGRFFSEEAARQLLDTFNS
jgi:hypothetical protein